MTGKPESVSLSDKYIKRQGPVFMTGTQVLVRLMLEQAGMDRRRGLETSGFVSGYRGSPLAGLDQALWSAQEHLDPARVRFQPAINEELAATAIIGTQQVGFYPGANTDGVFSLWYGKGVGSDRASDALKHANLMGTSPRGGVLVVVGDDHGAMSSATAHQCDQAMESWLMPFLHPADFDDYLDFGLKGFALSRFAGCYVGFKVVSETVEAGAVVDLPAHRRPAVEPAGFSLPPGGLNIRWPDRQLVQEDRHVNHRLRAAQAFARANGIDREVWPGRKGGVGVVTVGKAHGDFLQAMEDLGIDEGEARSLGLGLYKVGMPWPLEPEGARAFCRGLETVLVVEEKRSFVEKQLKDLLYNMPSGLRPGVLGKEDADGRPLLPAAGQLTSADVALALCRVMPALRWREASRRHAAFLEDLHGELDPASAPMRKPHFCAGCPHSLSTRLPDGSRAHTGTGCHLMAAFMDRDTSSLLQMGGEGANWIGQAPYTETGHVFQNLGDGTYHHSGSLAVRQAVAAKADMTFKILVNDAVAMTGGQPVGEGFDAARLSRQIAAEGVGHIAVVYDSPESIPAKRSFARGCTFHPRRDLDAVQRELREVAGVSVLIYVQPCAAQLRRQRRRGRAAEIRRRVFIHPDVCEGCGDCVAQSSCPALTLLDTPMGQKRRVDQSMCNGDLACLDGLCPAFVSVEGTLSELRDGPRGRALPADAVPEPDPADPARPHNIAITGVGGNGIITVGHILAMAALQEGKGATCLNFTGLSQKGGGVVSHVRISSRPGLIGQPRIPQGGSDLLLAGDVITACGLESLATLDGARSSVVGNSYLQPTADQMADAALSYDEAGLRDMLTERSRGGQTHFMNATRLSETLTGHSITAYMFLLGYAFQKGHVPLGRDTLLRAMELNGVLVEQNRTSFEWGRLAAHDPGAFQEQTGPLLDPPVEPESLEGIVARHSEHLQRYQNPAYARRYRELVGRVREAEQAAAPGDLPLTRAVAAAYGRVLAYKDEYEVARLYGEGSFLRDVRGRFQGGGSLSYHLAPDLIAARDRWSGRVRKRTYGAILSPVLAGLAKMKALRGTPFDVFALTRERRAEQALVGEYEEVVETLLAGLRPGNHGRAVDIARAPDGIKGFGVVKQAAMDEVRRYWRNELPRFI